MSRQPPPGSPPLPPPDLSDRKLPLGEIDPGTALHRIHRTKHGALHFGRQSDPFRRQRWDAPDASYGVCYVAMEDHVAFAETLLREVGVRHVHADDLRPRSLARIEGTTDALRVVEMNDQHLNAIGADASVVQGPYEVTWAWSKAIHEHPVRPDGIRYRARHDDSGFSIAVFERAEARLTRISSVELLDPTMRRTLGSWLDRYGRGLVE